MADTYLYFVTGYAVLVLVLYVSIAGLHCRIRSMQKRLDQLEKK